MSPGRFNHLLEIIGPMIAKNHAVRAPAIPQVERLAITLRFLAIKKYEKHPSILKMKKITKTKETFNFLNITEKDISVIVKNLNPSKATTHKNIPIKKDL